MMKAFYSFMAAAAILLLANCSGANDPLEKELAELRSTLQEQYGEPSVLDVPSPGTYVDHLTELTDKTEGMIPTGYLKIKGELNGTDLSYLRYRVLPAYSGEVKVLDLTEASFVIGDDPYYEDDHRTCKIEEENVVSPFTFYGCGVLEYLLLPTTTTAIRNSAFSGCGNLQGIWMPATVTSIGDYAFYGCSALPDDFALPASVESIGELAFAGCSFTRFTLPDGIKSLGKRIFFACNNLRELHVPVSLTDIDDTTFEGCQASMSDVYVAWSESEFAPFFEKAFSYETGNTKLMDESRITLHVPTQYLQEYQAAHGIKFMNIVGED